MPSKAKTKAPKAKGVNPKRASMHNAPKRSISDDSHHDPSKKPAHGAPAKASLLPMPLPDSDEDAIALTSSNEDEDTLQVPTFLKTKDTGFGAGTSLATPVPPKVCNSPKTNLDAN
jgi:hypothetical protein